VRDREWEPNDLPPSASRAELDRKVEGYLPVIKDIDWFQFPLRPSTQDSRIRIEVTPPPGLALRVELADTLGGKLGRGAGEPGQTVCLRGVGVHQWKPITAS